MRHILYVIGVTAFLILNSYSLSAQDTTFNRVVTVERDYKPEINQATIIPLQPAFLQVEVDPNPIIYSTYSYPVSIGYNLHPLQAAETRFNPPTPSYGLLDGAIGHHNTHLDFLYQLRETPNFLADIYAKHNAYWGNNTLSNSKIGMQGSYYFNKSKLYFGINGDNEAYSIYTQDKLQSLYNTAAYIGFSSDSQTKIQYNIQVGYNAFFTPINIEHQIHSNLDLYWKQDAHKGGVRVYIQNNMYANNDAIHNIHLQPFYAFEKEKIRLEVGMNLDMNIGTEKMLSATENLSFAPSPHLNLKWLVIPQIFNIHTEIEGYFAKGTIEEALRSNRYFNIEELAKDRKSKTYTPFTANIGFIVHPLRTMILDVYGGYSLYKNDYTMVAEINNNDLTTYSYTLNDYQRGHIGTTLNYHFRDIIKLKAGGNYYFWKNLSTDMLVYDRPDWDASLHVDVNINQKWSIYTDNLLEGKRLAHTTQQDEELPMVINLNVGGKYSINRWLNVYLQFGNYLNRTHYYFYKYPTQGFHFLAGVKYAF